MERRGLSESIVRTVVEGPEQRLMERAGREVFQSRIGLGGGGRPFLVRVVVDVDRTPADIVTAYRTSNIGRYWREDP